MPVQAQPLIAVSDVPAASRWYCELLGCSSSHGGDEYERLVDGERLILQLHRWDAHGHPHLGSPDERPIGNGALIWFQHDDFDAVARRAVAMSATVLLAPHENPSAGHREIWLQDLDGYKVVIASPMEFEPRAGDA